MNKTLHGESCIFQHRGAAIGAALAFLAFGVYSAMTITAGTLATSPGTAFIVARVAVLGVALLIAIQSKCWAERAVMVILAAIIVSRFLATTLTVAPYLVKVQSVLAIGAYFACAVLVLLDMVRQRESPEPKGE
jgi:hypothetical protein